MKVFKDYILKDIKILEDILKKRKESIIDKNISKKVEKILTDVKLTGNSAITKYTKKFDNVKLIPEDFLVKEREYEEAFEKVSKEFLYAIKSAKKNIFNFHKKESSRKIVSDNNGIKLFLDIKPIDSVGIYVPGGKYSYPSTLLMCVIPAKVANVPRIVVCSPKVSPYLLVVAKECGVDEFYKIGGVQAIGALAFGTKTIKKVDKIVGPGNAFVTEAKRQVFGRVGIDLLAGPSEIMIIADKSANSEFVSYDLLAQAEHDKNALAVLITTSKKLAYRVNKSIGLKLKNDCLKKELSRIVNISIIIVKNLDRAIEVINDYGPEHLEIILKNNEKFAGKIKNAGSILIGEYSTASLTDYTAGVNHVLPTGGTAKFSSVLTVDDFIKKINIVKISKPGLKKLANVTSILAKIERFNYHKESIEIRL